MAGEIAAAIEDVDEGDEVHGRVLVSENEVAEGAREGGEDRHEGKIDDER